MNERIKELANLADDTHEAENKLWSEKFAELIVADIINVLESDNTIRHIAYTTFDLDLVEGAVGKSINAITAHYGMKQHFRKPNERTMGRKVSSL